MTKYYLKKKKECPWELTYNRILSRCNNPNTPGYRNYGGRGIKCLITPEELKTLWIRDEAHLLKTASIDRIDSNGNYIISNCRYIERSANCSKHHTRNCPRGKNHPNYKKGIYDGLYRGSFKNGKYVPVSERPKFIKSQKLKDEIKKKCKKYWKNSWRNQLSKLLEKKLVEKYK